MGVGTMTARNEKGLAGTVLIITIAWALSAVLMLTGTLVAAQQIDDQVEVILGEVSPIDKDLDSVRLAEETNRIASEILDAAEPLSGQLDQVIASVGTIDKSVEDILGTARTINGTVKDINSTATGIGSTVDSIGGNVSSILSVVRSIEAGVTAINGRADVVVGLVRGIRKDVRNVLVQVGPGHGNPGNASIHGHANSIDCSPAVVVLSQHCGQ